MGLGSYPAISLKAARIRAAELRTQKASGSDPIDAKHTALADARAKHNNRRTFKECAESFIEKEKYGWTHKTHLKWRHCVDVNCRLILNKSISDIQTEHILAVLKPIWFDTTYSATRTRARIQSIFEHARELKWFTGENPAAWRGSIRAHLPKPSSIYRQKNHPALHFSMVPDFMDTLLDMGAFELSGTMSVKALTLTLLTACRVGEVVKAEWSEINFKDKLWTIPGARMKQGAEHVVPLSNHAITILKTLYPYTSQFGLVFPGDRWKNGKPASLTIAAPYKVFKEINPDCTVHGLRSTFRSWAGANTDYSEDLLESALAHALKDKVKAAYMRDKLVDKRRPLMDDWEAYCMSNSPSN